MSQGTPSSLRLLPVSLLLIFLDQASKLMATFLMDYATAVPIVPSLNLFLIHNEGVAFSFLADAGGWQRYVFTVLSTIISIALLVWMKKTPLTQTLLSMTLVLVLAGAVGNLIDRVISGYVVDFIDVYWKGYHWPVFNFADIYISIGVAIIIFDNLWEIKKSKTKQALIKCQDSNPKASSTNKKTNQ